MLNNKKILIITYYYPPAGGSGVQRWLKFAKYLPDFGITPIILKPKNPCYSIFDFLLLNEIPKSQEIIEIPIWEPYSLSRMINPKNIKYEIGQFDVNNNHDFLSRILIFIRANFLIPDPRKFWINPCYKFLKKYLYDNNIKHIITTGPPHSLHLIGLKLKKNNPNLKWIADFRDPWLNILHEEKLKILNFAKKKHEKLEKNVLNNSDLILVTNYSDVYKNQKLGIHNCVTITNGFDSVFSKKKEKNKKFTITYCGIMEQLRNPIILWEIIIELINSNLINSKYFELKLIGKIDQKILYKINNSILKKILNFKGYLSHQVCLEEINNSNLLLITNFKSNKYKGIIPGKLFDYLSTYNKILSIGPKSSDVEKILNITQIGKHFNYEQKIEIKSFVINSYYDWINDISYNYDNQNIMKFHRKNLTKILSEKIHSLK